MNVGYCPGYCCVANRELGRCIVRYRSHSAVVTSCRGAKGYACCIALTGVCINCYSCRTGDRRVLVVIDCDRLGTGCRVTMIVSYCPGDCCGSDRELGRCVVRH